MVLKLSLRRLVGLWLLGGLLAFSVMTHADPVTAEPRASAQDSWLSRQVTVPNILMLATFLMHLGMVRQDFKYLKGNVEKHQAWIDGHDSRMRSDFVQRGEMESELRSIHGAVERVATLCDSMTTRIDDLVGRPQLKR